MSSFPAVNRLEPAFNVSIPALSDGLFSYHDEDLDISVSWSPHPNLVPGIRQRVVEAVGRLPREWLAPPIDGELFDTVQDAEARVQGHSLAAGRLPDSYRAGLNADSEEFTMCSSRGENSERSRSLRESRTGS
jgi:hypothetical protein